MPLGLFEEEFPLLVKALRDAKRSKRLGHAYLLYSDDPDLRRNFSLAVAQMVLCLSPTEDSDACGVCKNCKQVEAEAYSELYILEPTSKSRKIKIGDDKRDSDTLRWFENLFYLKSSAEAGIKFGIIMDAECLMPQAQNAFLKTLEEPPGNSMFILATGNPSSLLTTIRSRCQFLSLIRNHRDYDFPKSQELLSLLYELQFQHGTDAAENRAARLIALIQGVKSEIEKEIGEKWAERLKTLELLEAPAKKRILERYNAAIQAEYIRRRTYYLSAIHSWFAQVYQLSQNVPIAKLANPEILEPFEIDISMIDPEKARHALGKSEELLDNLKWNVNEELAFREFCLNL